jgi:hypothetical protein
MDLDARQTRSVFLAGTVTFPRPFPSTGTISLLKGNWTYADGEERVEKDLLIVQEFRCHRTVVHVMLQTDVSALFIPGVTRGGRFRISKKRRVDNFERGEWFLDTDVRVNKICDRLNLRDDDFANRNSVLRGIVFVRRGSRIFRVTEVSTIAGAYDKPAKYDCTCELRVSCTCEE